MLQALPSSSTESAWDRDDPLNRSVKRRVGARGPFSDATGGSPQVEMPPSAPAEAGHAPVPPPEDDAELSDPPSPIALFARPKPPNAPLMPHAVFPRLPEDRRVVRASRRRAVARRQHEELSVEAPPVWHASAAMVDHPEMAGLTFPLFCGVASANGAVARAA